MGCATKLSYGIVGLQNGKVKSLREKQILMLSFSKKKKFVGYVYSGISIINKNLLFKIKFKNFKNFEKFYPKIIKKLNQALKQLMDFGTL